MQKLLLVCSLVGLGACASAAVDDDPAHVRTWATTSSALGVFAQAARPIAVSDGRDPFVDPACPQVADDGTRMTITGGCTDTAGIEHFGSVAIVRDASGRTLTFASYGESSAIGEVRTSGTFTIRDMSPTRHEFDASLSLEGGTTTTITYSGVVDGAYDGPTTWSGSGTVERRGGFLGPTGTIDATTIDELSDGTVCSNQPASGQTTIRADGRTVVITYDGATDCDMAQAARWSFDGTDRGTVDGITCAVGHGRGASTFALVLAGAALIFTRRRHRG